MRAATYDRVGPAGEVLRVGDIERPEPGPGQVRVRLAVSGINPTDVKARGGSVPRPIDGFQIPHQDGAGHIDAVGAGVDPGRVGQPVWLWFAAAGSRFGTAAEWTVVPERQAVPLPPNASLELGAGLGVPAVTAAHCLFADGPLDGAAVLVAGGAGAVGHFAVELASRAGARVVSTVSKPWQADLARAAGAHHVVDYTDPDAAEQIRSFLTTGVDRVIEVAIGANLPLDLAVAGPAATIVSYAAAGADPALPVRACMTANVTLKFMLLYTLTDAQLDAAVGHVGSALAQGALTPQPMTRFPLDRVAQAHEAVEAGGSGKVVLDLP